MKEDFAALVQSLPAELYDEIYDLTFTSNLKTGRVVDKRWKPPSCMQVNRMTRRHFAKLYYGSTSPFYVEKSVAVKWAAGLHEDHRRYIREIRIPGTSAAQFARVDHPSRLRQRQDQDDFLVEIYQKLDRYVVKVKAMLSGWKTMRWVSIAEMRGGS